MANGGKTPEMIEKEIIENAKKCCEPFEVRDIVKQQQETINRQRAEIEKQRADKIRLIEHFEEREKEVVKEFADRLKEKIGDSHFQNYGLAILEIHDLVKEMVGDDK